VGRTVLFCTAFLRIQNVFIFWHEMRFKSFSAYLFLKGTFRSSRNRRFLLQNLAEALKD